MKRFLFFLLCLVGLSLGQSTTLLSGDFEEDGSGIAYTGSYNSTDVAVDKFLGFEVFTLDIDSLPSLTDATGTVRDNTIAFINEYKRNGKWWTGDSIRWDRFDTSNLESSIIQRNLVWISPITYNDSLLVWHNDPTDTSNIQGLIWKERRVKIVWSDSVSFNNLNLEVEVH